MQSTSNQNEQINIENSYRVWLGSLPLPTLMEFLERDVKNNPNTNINLVYDSSMITEKDNITLKENGWVENGRDVLSVRQINEKYTESRGLKLIDLKEKEFGDDFLKKVIYEKIDYQKNNKDNKCNVADWISLYVLVHEKNVAWFDTDVDVIRPLNDIANEANSREGNLGMLNNSYLDDYANIKEKDKNVMIGNDATIVFNDKATNCFKISFEVFKFYFTLKSLPKEPIIIHNPASRFIFNLLQYTIEFDKREERCCVAASLRNDFNIHLYAAVLMEANEYSEITVDRLPEYNEKRREVIEKIKFPENSILVNKFLTVDYKCGVNAMTIEQKRYEKDIGIRNQHKTTTLKVCNYIVEAMEKGRNINKNGIYDTIDELALYGTGISMFLDSFVYRPIMLHMSEGYQTNDQERVDRINLN